MAPRTKEVTSTMPGLWKYPTYRDDTLKSSTLWLKGKREDDGAEGLWRIHDQLYDLSDWMHRHPGGTDWLALTKGTDITEAFESHHLATAAERLLPSFHVRPAKTRRNSPYTFNEDGFYRTLKRRVRDKLKGAPTGPTSESKLIADLLFVGTLATAILAATLNSYWMATLSGVLLSFLTVCSHNFFHQKDNFRMYYFDISLMSSRDWRVSHGLSHHLYPNSLLDLEISMFEPMLQWLPKEKTFWEKYGSWLYSPFLYATLYHMQVVLRLRLFFTGHKIMNQTSVLRWSDLTGFSIPLLMYFVGGGGIIDVLFLWTYIIMASSFSFAVIGVNGAHHHPDIFHDGDASRADRDWGLLQLDAVRDRKEISKNLFLVLTNFGHHSLHHLFPTVDHGRLDPLYPILEQTCRDFGIDYEESFTSNVVDCITGQFMQLTRTEPNTTAPAAKPIKTKTK